MAKIIYGVAGEGFGHSSRSHLIGQRLLDAGNDVIGASFDTPPSRSGCLEARNETGIGCEAQSGDGNAVPFDDFS